jgi:hypothetical protein
MRGIRLTFNESGPNFDFSTAVRRFDSTVQNALVNVGTDLGSDKVYTTRGTDLKRDGANGRMSTAVWANHSANFAALRTLAFVQQTDIETNPFKLQEFTLRCQTVILTTAVLEVQAVSTLGQVVGGFANI